jgi:hypothetical protein
VKQYREQLSDDIIFIKLFSKIRKKLWGKSTTALEDKSCSGGGARQPRRLKAKKVCEASEGETLAKKSCAVLPTKPNKKKQKVLQSFNNNATLEKLPCRGYLNNSSLFYLLFILNVCCFVLFNVC